MFNLVNLYKFTINGRKALVTGKTVIDAIRTIKNELGDVEYSFNGKVE